MLHFNWVHIFQHGVGRNTTYRSNLFVFCFWLEIPAWILEQKDTQLEGKTHAELQIF